MCTRTHAAYTHAHRMRKKYGNPKKILKNMFYGKMFQTKIVEFKKIYDLFTD